MNDPHVIALIYQIERSRAVDYRRAKPLDHEEAGFRIKIESHQVRFEFKDHYATEEAAREVLAGYIREWEFAAGLCRGSDHFRLKFDRAQIEDRNPTPGVVEGLAGAIRFNIATSMARITVRSARYPRPPSGIKITPDVEVMYSRYLGLPFTHILHRAH